MPYEEDKFGKSGAPTKWTQELQDELCCLLRDGAFIESACDQVGIDSRTYRYWLKGDQPHHLLFQKAVREATSSCENEAAAKVYVAGQTDADLMLKFMAKRWSERWGDTKKVTIAVEKELESALDKLQGKLTPEEFERVVSIIAAEEAGSEAAESDSGDTEE